ncbi:hypothetical protein DMH15_26490 [Streptomyces sp. WAC 06725]|nr:hypothetical protein DMH15_26490 [Streptomyces sp. WAC 06725]
MTEGFRCDSAEVKRPLRDAVLEVGWTWRGVAFGKLRPTCETRQLGYVPQNAYSVTSMMLWIFIVMALILGSMTMWLSVRCRGEQRESGSRWLPRGVVEKAALG